ncbi:helix-turn-helix transcriptional regulator [Vibrio cincinnatiensis]|uniref:helix-turn-helix transcriptional regulator n=1 Tax=Vibrio cincinnatiensis TaxID=675 RepID=UPI001EDD4152|nr:AraC family transcriptional regulator [Vibrio cincinnatiensis]
MQEIAFLDVNNSVFSEFKYTDSIIENEIIGTKLYRILHKYGYQNRYEISRLLEVFNKNGFHRAFLTNSKNLDDLLLKLKLIIEYNSKGIKIEKKERSERVFVYFEYLDDRKHFYSPHASLYMLSIFIEDILNSVKNFDFEFGFSKSVLDEDKFIEKGIIKENVGKDYLSFPKKLLHYTNKNYNNNINSFFDEQIRIRYHNERNINDLMDYNPNGNFELINDIKQFVLEYFNLSEQFPTIDFISDKLNMSRATLHRHLAKKETSYQIILDEMKMIKSAQLIKYSDFNISDVSYKLGYSNTSSFIRAFKRWFNMSPNQYKSIK